MGGTATMLLAYLDWLDWAIGTGPIISFRIKDKLIGMILHDSSLPDLMLTTLLCLTLCFLPGPRVFQRSPTSRSEINPAHQRVSDVRRQWRRVALHLHSPVARTTPLPR